MTSRVATIAALVCLAAGGCASTTAGTAMPAGNAPLTTAEALPTLLLPAAEVGAAMSGADLVVTREVTAPWDDGARLAEGAGCLAVAGAAQRSVYADSGWTALHGQILREPPASQWSHFATQVVVLFPTAEAAGDFFARSRDLWAGCADRELAYPQQLAPEQLWSIGPAAVDDDVLALTRTQRSPERWSCQRALRVHRNVAVDVEACDLDGPTSAAAAIAATIAGRLPTA